MTILVGGGGGVGPTGATGPAIAGLTSDGANGVIVAEVLAAGDTNANAGTFPNQHHLIGSTVIEDAAGNCPDGDETAYVSQGRGLTQNHTAAALRVIRSGLLNGHQYTKATLAVEDNSGTTAPLQTWVAQVMTVAAIGQEGGLGLFGHAVPTAPRTLAQATITAIIDANAKAAVQACANALSDMGVLTLT